MQVVWVWSLVRGMATHSSILAWRIPMGRGAWRATVHGITKSWTPRNGKVQHTGSQDPTSLVAKIPKHKQCYHRFKKTSFKRVHTKKILIKKKNSSKKRITHAMSKGSDVIRPPWNWKFLRNIATLLQWATIVNGNVWKLKKRKKERSWWPVGI